MPDDTRLSRVNYFTAMRRLSEQRSTWLLVYDNVPTPDAVANLLPSAGARVLITSRFSDWSEQADEVALDVLPLEEAVALLENRAGRSDAAGAKTLAEAVDRLPLRAFITSAKAPPNALGRTEDVKALRERYGLRSSDDPKP